MDAPAAALEKMLAEVRQPDSETVGLDAAWGRTLAAPVIASRDQPPFRASAMDGYAVRRSDLASGVPLKITGTSAAGAGYSGALSTNAAVRIFTGAPVPDGADCVVPQEATSVEHDFVRVTLPAGHNIRERAVDFSAGARLIERGIRLDGIALALAAAAGQASVSATKAPRIAVLATGSELAMPALPVGANQVFESVSYGVIGLINTWGGSPVRMQPQTDVMAAIAEEAESGLQQSDLLVTIGGASVGDHDVVKAALTSLDLEMIVHRVAIKPGKPTWFARTRLGPVLGLPGNPVAALVCAYLFARPLIERMLGRPVVATTRRARTLAPLPANGALEHYLRARSDLDTDGRLHVRSLAQQDTSVLSALSQANTLLRRPAGAAAVNVGALVDVILLERP